MMAGAEPVNSERKLVVGRNGDTGRTGQQQQERGEKMQQNHMEGPNMGAYPQDQMAQDCSCSGTAGFQRTGGRPGMDASNWTGTHHMRYPRGVGCHDNPHGASEWDYPAAGSISPAASPAFGGGWFDFSNGCYLKGFALGAGITLLLTNSSVQKALVKGVVKVWSIVQGGVEEVKETFQDVKAEMSQDGQ